MLRIIICDDVKANIITIIQNIRDIISNISISKEIEVFSARPDSLINYRIKDNYTYLFILDVVYKDINGIDIAKKIRKQNKDVFIIFVTKHIELLHMIINQNIMPSGFYGKPIEENDIRKAVFNIIDCYKENNKTLVQTLTINTNSTVYKIPYDEILYVESFNKKVYIYSDTQRISCYNSLQTLETELGESFIRCHKSYIVNKNKIKNVSFDDMLIEMNNGNKILMSRNCKGKIKKLYSGGEA